MSKLKIGVIGISAHFTNKILLPVSRSEHVEIYGVASRSLEKSQAFAKKWSIPKSYASYEALLADPVIEAVYIPLPNHMHLEWIKKSADAGKHIICEKPLTMDAAETEEIMAYLKHKNVKCMEAFMYRFHPKWLHARDLITFGEIGEVYAIHTIFTYNNQDPENIRNIKAFGGGALMDIGCYAISSACFLLGREPKKVISLIHEHDMFKTDVRTSAMLDFGDVRAQFTVATNTFPAQEVTAYGTGGVLTVKVPFNDCSDVSGELDIRTGVGSRTAKFHPVNQYLLQFEEFARSIRENTDLPISLDDSLRNMKIIDAITTSALTGSWVDLK